MSEEINKEVTMKETPTVIDNDQTPVEEQGEVQTQPMESMEDYAAELEASFKRVKEGDILTGSVISITDTEVTLDLKYYAPGIITKENLSNDPNFNMNEEIKKGDEITATVIKTDDGEGNLLLSKKEANDILAWDKLAELMENRTVVTIRVIEAVKAGVVTFLEGIRGFIPASKLDIGYVEDLDPWVGKELDVTVITADKENKKLVLSAKEIAREKAAAENQKRIARCEVGFVMEGIVETIKDYGAFIKLDNGLSGLLHISQISAKRIKSPAAVLQIGQKVTVKIISTTDHKISLSMKALEAGEQAENIEVFDYKESGIATTGLGSLLKGLKIN